MLPFTSCVIVKSLKLSVPQFPYLWNGYKDSAYCRGWERDSMTWKVWGIQPAPINTGFCRLRHFQTRLKQVLVLEPTSSCTSCSQTSRSYLRNHPCCSAPLHTHRSRKQLSLRLPRTSFWPSLRNSYLQSFLSHPPLSLLEFFFLTLAHKVISWSCWT